jgi:hypothetical protein
MKKYFIQDVESGKWLTVTHRLTKDPNNPGLCAFDTAEEAQSYLDSQPHNSEDWTITVYLYA